MIDNLFNVPDNGCVMASIEEALSRFDEYATRPPPLPEPVVRLAQAWDRANERERWAFGTPMYRTRVVLADVIYHELDAACRQHDLDTNTVIRAIRSTY